ncbi:hypothetical protein ACFOZ0_19735 [Streptomyces yaanensis]|uniref:Lipoprotein n=1 Tax=Streptomyces yaanensis TaxID=1142239 RepID=A0ABV7SER5_9ACTN|nr:hypothetical protein [Streptomyces sp. CGMCC 4.7035]WNB97912.1 hypothetical protein Q2K21_07365 [Streptomyces sp. CGMCC 4.7035]
MAPLRTRSVLAAAAFIAGTALLTACQGGGADSASSADTAKATATSTQTAADQSATDSPNSTASAGSGGSGKSTSNQSGSSSGSGKSGSGSSGSGSSGSGSSGSGSSSSSNTIEGINNGKGVNGQWHGIVHYLAPGKYTVGDWKDQEQQFFVSNGTEIWGAGTVCGDKNGQAADKCTEAELEAAAKKGFEADVTVRNGIATEIREG